jgi:hypothetical protein
MEDCAVRYLPLLNKMLCVAFGVAIVFPLGAAVFPFYAGEVSAMPFHAGQALVSATIGFALHGTVFKRGEE